MSTLKQRKLNLAKRVDKLKTKHQVCSSESSLTYLNCPRCWLSPSGLWLFKNWNWEHRILKKILINFHQEVYWIVKASCANQQADIVDVDRNHYDADSRCVARLQHEIKVYTLLLADIAKFLESRKNPRAKFLLNIPSLVRFFSRWMKVLFLQYTKKSSHRKNLNPLNPFRVFNKNAEWKRNHRKIECVRQTKYKFFAAGKVFETKKQKKEISTGIKKS